MEVGNNAKFQLNISKIMPARPKSTGTGSVNTSIHVIIKQGDIGEQGPQGLAGLPGSKGQKGGPGSPGSNGQNGAKGDRGYQGQTGRQGRQGSDGGRGRKGDRGDRGEQGEPGEAGPPGNYTDLDQPQGKLKTITTLVVSSPCPCFFLPLLLSGKGLYL